MRIVLIGVSVALVLTISAIYLTRHGCSMIGGRWASYRGLRIGKDTWGICVTPLCHYFDSCGWWLMPKIPCDQIPPDVSYPYLHFLLGDPSLKNENQYFWSFGKGDLPLKVSAKVIGTKVDRFECPVNDNHKSDVSQ